MIILSEPPYCGPPIDVRPERIQLSRQRGFNLQAASQALNGLPAVKVDRTSRWGNPWIIGAPIDLRQAKRWGWAISPGGRRFVCKTAEQAVAHFRYALAFDEAIHPFLRQQLGGRNLACWCTLDCACCHGDVLLEAANG